MNETTVDYRVLPDGSLRAEPTPGPWHTDKYDALGLNVWRHTVKDEAGEMVAAAYGPIGTDEANARLIASAPTLRAALERILERVSTSLYAEPVPIPEDALLAAVFERVAIRDEARAALASAPGGGSL